MIALSQDVNRIQDARILLEAHQELGELIVEAVTHGDMKLADRLKTIRENVALIIKH